MHSRNLHNRLNLYLRPSSHQLIFSLLLDAKYFYSALLSFALLFHISTFTTSSFARHFIWYSFDRCSRSQTIALIWWIVINIDVRAVECLGSERCEINHCVQESKEKNDDKECSEWEERRTTHMDYREKILQLHRRLMLRWCNSTLPISCSIYFLWCCINNGWENNYRSTRVWVERSEQHSLRVFLLLSF